jgi:hypothetical protein
MYGKEDFLKLLEYLTAIIKSETYSCCFNLLTGNFVISTTNLIHT